MNHINFTFARLNSFFFKIHLFLFFSIFLFISIFFFLDTTIPFSHFLLPNEYGSYKLEGRKAIFNGDNKAYLKSLILKEGISDAVLEVFVFLLLIIFLIILLLFVIIIICDG
jgi:hypothetical protein